MKTTDPRDSLDRRIDRLLAGKPLRPGDDFTDRVLAAAEARGLSAGGRQRSALRYLMPIAAAVVLAFAAAQVFFKPAPESAGSGLSTAEVREILFLEEGLSGLAALPLDEFDETGLEPTLDTITFGFES